MATKKSVRNAHLLLAAYWGYKLLNGGNPLKTTLNVLLMENRSIRDERQKESQRQQEQPEKGQAGKSRKVKSAKASAVQGTSGSARKKVSASAVSIARNKNVRSMAKKVLKSARVY